MANTNQDVKFKRGKHDTLPTTPDPGSILIETDTGDMFVDDDEFTRVQIGDSRSVKKSGDTMTGDLNMGNHKVTSSSTPSVNIDLTNKQYVDNQVKNKVSKSGDTMTGDLTMENNSKIRVSASVAENPTDDNEVVAKKYVDKVVGDAAAGNYLPISGGTMTGDLNMGSHKLNGLPEPLEGGEAANKNYVDTAVHQTYLGYLQGDPSVSNKTLGLQLIGEPSTVSINRLKVGDVLLLMCPEGNNVNSPTVTDGECTMTVSIGYMPPLTYFTIAVNYVSEDGNTISTYPVGVYDFNYGQPHASYDTCNTSGSSQIKRINSDRFKYLNSITEWDSVILLVKFDYNNTVADPKLQINELTACPIYYNTAPVPANYIQANRIYMFYYNKVDTRFYILNTLDSISSGEDTYLPLSGGTMTGPIDMGANKITSSSAPTANTDLVNKQYADKSLPKSGGTMTGAISMGANKITSSATPTANTDLVNKQYADKSLPKAGGAMTGPINMGNNQITNLATPAVNTDAATKKYVDDAVAGVDVSEQLNDYLPKSGGMMAGPINMGTNAITLTNDPTADTQAANKHYVDSLLDMVVARDIDENQGAKDIALLNSFGNNNYYVYTSSDITFYPSSGTLVIPKIDAIIDGGSID